MILRRHTLSALAFVLGLAFASQAWAKDKGDVYLGYSRVGANLYDANSPGMNGWQAATHVKLIPFVGVEGDFAHYSQSGSGFSEQVTTVMFGPRVTAHAAGFSIFAHGLGGLAHQGATVTTFASTGYNAFSYALGAGLDVPLIAGLKARVTGDYLGNGNTPPSSGLSTGNGISHYRFGVGLAYHF